MSVIFVYVTTGNEAEAKKIAEVVVADRLAACANVIPGMKSIYHWQGKIEEGTECVLILKTRATLFGALAERVKELHSYDNPCIVALPVVTASQPYLNWILDETQP